MKILAHLRDDMYIPIIIIAFYVFAFILAPFTYMMEGIFNILTSNGLLLTDFIYVSSLSSVLFASGTITLFNYILVKKVYGKIDGVAFAGLLCVLGFSFFGKTILNTIPIQIGVYLYTKYKKVEFRNYVPTALFATGIAPVVSYTLFGLDTYFLLALPIGLLLGVFCGFITPALAVKTTTFYDGLNMFNVGFASGLIATFIHALYRLAGFPVVRNEFLSYEYSKFLFIFILSISLFIIITSIICDRKSIRGFFKLSKTNDQCKCDYAKDFGNDTTLLNIGLVGLICLSLILILQVQISGPLAGTIFATMGFAGYRLHVRNFFPLLLGTILAGFFIREYYDTSLMIAIFLSSGLAPVVGRYGFIAGTISGFLVISVVPYMLDLQGGFGIYNVGFVTGFVAIIVVPLFAAFFKEKE